MNIDDAEHEIIRMRDPDKSIFARHRAADDCGNSHSLRIGCDCSSCERARIKIMQRELDQLRSAVNECRDTLCEVVKYQQASGPFWHGGEIMQRVKTTLSRIAITP